MYNILCHHNICLTSEEKEKKVRIVPETFSEGFITYTYLGNSVPHTYIHTRIWSHTCKNSLYVMIKDTKTVKNVLIGHTQTYKKDNRKNNKSLKIQHFIS